MQEVKFVARSQLKLKPEPQDNWREEFDAGESATSASDQTSALEEPCWWPSPKKASRYPGERRELLVAAMVGTGIIGGVIYAAGIAVTAILIGLVLIVLLVGGNWILDNTLDL